MTKERRAVIVNDRDEIIGHKYRYDMTDDDIYRVSVLWVVINDGGKYRVLIAQRKWTKKNNPGKWSLSAAGTVEENESYEENIYKEAEEEIGLTGAKLIPISKNFRDGKRNHFTMSYVTIGDWKLSDFTPQVSEVESLDLVDMDDLLRDTAENPDKYTRDFHERVTGLKKFLEQMR
ncbi:MAG: NUDIX domain-containing protein [Candidatus Nomurabacteria bacterium]|jgi:8-oxo-dGTP pyrophosphatase MutT (NUDIX family)|nr:NUDIX domain-containing protein [Candidatus Nomurabacteria bacterium]